MAERRKNKKKREVEAREGDSKPSKEEYAVAKYLKRKLPEKKTTLMGHKVEYFIGSKAVDLLMESEWAKPNKKKTLYFNNRDSVTNFMGRLLELKFFHRAKKIFVQKDPKKTKKKDAEEENRESDKEKDVEEEAEKEKETKKEKEVKKEKEAKKDKEKEVKKEKKNEAEKPKESKKSKKKAEVVTEKVEEKETEEKKKGDTVEKKKEKKKIKLDMHMEQIFIDTNEPYVWIYDPIPLKTWITGALLVVAAVAICLFPLWPQIIRHYIYYLSVGAAFLLVFIIGLAVLRIVVFVLIWVVTFGRHHIWLFPNLTEDVGFFASFWPLYKYEFKPAESEDKKHKKSSKKKSKASDSEQKKSDSETKNRDASDSETRDKDASDSETRDKDASDSEARDKDASDSEARDASDSEIRDKVQDSGEESGTDLEEQQKNDNGFVFLEAEEAGEANDGSAEKKKTK